MISDGGLRVRAAICTFDGTHIRLGEDSATLPSATLPKHISFLQDIWRWKAACSFQINHINREANQLGDSLANRAWSDDFQWNSITDVDSHCLYFLPANACGISFHGH